MSEKQFRNSLSYRAQLLLAFEINGKIRITMWKSRKYTQGEVVNLQSFLTSAQLRGDWSVSRPGLLVPWEIPPCTHWIIGCVMLLRVEKSGPVGDQTTIHRSSRP